MSSSHWKTYLGEMERALSRGDATEHTHRPALKSLIEELGSGLTATNEPKQCDAGAPDFIVMRGEVPIGYVEAKDVGKSLDVTEKSEQLTRYREGLSNLLLTDYLEFRWYRDGELALEPARIARADSKGNLTPDAEGIKRAESLFESFFTAKAVTVASPRELAERMARIARLLQDAIGKAMKTESKETGPLHSQLDGFHRVLLHDLTEAQFADMYAQTVCYGLFAARTNHTGQERFTRQHAPYELPNTNPFLKKLFSQIAGPDMAESIVWAVDNLTELLNAADIGAILRDFGRRTLRQDPVVHFYETFLAAYDPRMRELRGVYYTPEPVVSYIVRSIDHILKSDFGLEKGLADHSRVQVDTDVGKKTVHKVQILDPSTGTGTFLHGVVDHIYETFKGAKGMWSGYVATELLPRLYGFELLMAPYAVAHMKLGIQLAETGYDFKSGERLNVYLTNTLEEAVVLQNPGAFDRFLNEERDAANRVKKDAPVMVILGNPPYSGHSANIGQWMTNLLRGVDSTAKVSKTHSYFHVDGKELGERNPKWLNDDYVKFIRFAQWRIERTGYGVLGFITNHGYLDNPTFRGMRQSLMDTFDDIYILDLHGNAKKKETAPDGGEDKNVFDIQQGVSIGIFVKRKGKKTTPGTVRHADLWGAREKKDSAGRIISGKYAWLAAKDASSTKWKKLKPKSPGYFFIPQDERLRKEYEAGWPIREIMPVNSVGIVTARDDLTIGFTKEEIWKRVNDFAQLPVEDARAKYDLGNDTRDWKVSLAQEDLKKSGLKKELLTAILYRPFDMRSTYYTATSRGFHCMPRGDVMRHMLAGRNLGLIATRLTKEKWDSFVSRKICGHKTCAAYDINSLFPLYLYPNKKTNGDIFTNGLAKHVNLAPEFIAEVEQKLSMKFIGTAAILAACQQDAGGTKGNADVAIRNRGRLPHWEMEGGVYFVTFRLADSLPQRILELYQAEREEILERAKRPGRELTPLEQQKLAELFSEKIDGFLDSGAGERYMDNPRISRLVTEALTRFDGERYYLYAYCVMPNHVHVVFRPFSNHPLEKTLHSWKSYTSNKANKILGRSGAFWQREYYDHVIRDEEEFNRIIEYVAMNPVKANLHDWQWVYVRSTAAVPAACQQDAGGTNKNTQDAKTFGPEDVFHYIYAIFHSPTYRDRYAPFLKGDFPRVPLTANAELFKKLVKLGERLTALHLMEADGRALPLFPVMGDNIVEKARYTGPGEGADEGRVFINKTQYFAPVPPEVWNFHVGGYQVAEKWLKDRKGRQLSFTEFEHYQKTIAALAETIALMNGIDTAIEEHAGWPIGDITP